MSTSTCAFSNVAACRASVSVAFCLCLLVPVLPLWRAHRRVLAYLAQSAAAKLPLDTLNDPAAAAAAAAAAWAAVRVARAMSAQGMAGDGRVDGDARAAKAASRVAEAVVASMAAAVAWHVVSVVQAVVGHGSRGVRKLDFGVSFDASSAARPAARSRVLRSSMSDRSRA